MFKFSTGLVERCKNYFARTYDIEITSEQAEVFLSSLGDLYLSACDDPAAAPQGGADGRRTLILD